MNIIDLQEEKTYIGHSTGLEYKIMSHRLQYRKPTGPYLYALDFYHYTQNFTPKEEIQIAKEYGWINKYPNGAYGRLYSTKEAADDSAGPDRIACIEMYGSYEVGGKK